MEATWAGQTVDVEAAKHVDRRGHVYNVGDVIELLGNSRCKGIGNASAHKSKAGQKMTIAELFATNEQGYDAIARTEAGVLMWINTKDSAVSELAQFKREFDIAMHVIKAYVLEMDILIGTTANGRFYAKAWAEAKEKYK